MSKVDLKSLSTEELWALREELTPMLAKRLEERSESLASRMAQLKSQPARRREPFPNEVHGLQAGDDWRQEVLADLRALTRWLEARSAQSDAGSRTDDPKPGAKRNVG